MCHTKSGLAPWIAKVDGEFFPAKYYFTVDYTDSEVADDPAQHKQSHVLELLDAGEYTGNIVALPNNRVRVTHPAWFETGQGAPDGQNVLLILTLAHMLIWLPLSTVKILTMLRVVKERRKSNG